jgi:hypothetical protein
VHHADTQCGSGAGAGNLHRFAVEFDFTQARLLYTREDFHQGGFPCAILADDHIHPRQTL